MDQPKLERLLRLMTMLTANNSYTVDDLSDKLDMSKRTIYPYIDTFRAAGFVIKKHGEYTRIEESSPHFNDISQLVHFTTEEACILKSAIESIDENNLLKQNLKKKLQHTSGHADINGLKRMIEAVRPKHIVPIHTFNGNEYAELFYNWKVVDVKDRQQIDIL